MPCFPVPSFILQSEFAVGGEAGFRFSAKDPTPNTKRLNIHYKLCAHSFLDFSRDASSADPPHFGHHRKQKQRAGRIGSLR